MRMDRIFNAVLMAQARAGPVSIMMRTARALDGDGFARFMLGAGHHCGLGQSDTGHAQDALPQTGMAPMSSWDLIAIAAVLLLGVPHGGLDGAVARRVGWPPGLAAWLGFHLALYSAGRAGRAAVVAVPPSPA